MGYGPTDCGTMQCTQMGTADGTGKGASCEGVDGCSSLRRCYIAKEGVEEVDGELLAAAQWRS